MDKVSNAEINKNDINEISSKECIEDEKSNNVQLRTCSNSNSCWINDNEGGKIDSRQRWSFGSDISIEAVENSLNRLCCSPVDEFDSSISSGSEDLIVNGAGDRNETYKNYIQVTPACSPTFNKIICNTDNKKCNKNIDADTADDELIDYSKRYTTDSSISLPNNKHVTQAHIQPHQQQQRHRVVNTVRRHVPEKKSTSVNNRSKPDIFRDYAQTDLDQPTDYSLRYAEEDTDEEDKENPRFYCNNEQEDTVKTYYTEGTPYQTPCNFSAATSMSDLLCIEDTREGDETVYKQQILIERKQERIEKPEKVLKYCKNRINKKYVSDISKIPVLEVLAEINDESTCERKSEKLHIPPPSPAEPNDKVKESRPVTYAEENYAQGTPLMFSRSSSLDSLSEFEQHSIHDDQSSVISDFSHRTSAVVSPSELPDSPTQTIPQNYGKLKHPNFDNQLQQTQRVPSRPIRKPPAQIDQENEEKKQIINSLSHGREPSYEKSDRVVEHHSSVFEDGVVAFKEESIPMRDHSTRASSLSALTVEDDSTDGIYECDNREILNKIAAIKVRTGAAGMLQVQKQYRNDTYAHADKFLRPQQNNKVLNRHLGYRNNNLLVSPTKKEIHFINIEEDNNDYLTNFVNKEIQNNKYRDSLKDSWYQDDFRKDHRSHTDRSLSRSPISKRNNPIISPQKIDVDEIITMDTIRIYCTEDTPTYVSPFGSQSNLSALSILSTSEENINFNTHYSEDEQPRSFYEEERSSSQVDAYDTDTSSDFPEDDDGCNYDEEDLMNLRRRIDVSPFDSQINLTNFSLLCIEEESEQEEDEEETNNETDKSVKNSDRQL